MIVEQFKEMVIPIILQGLVSFIPLLFQIAAFVISFCAVIFVLYSVITVVCPELRGIIFGTIGGMLDNYKADRKERFANSPVGRGYAAYKERSGVHDGAEGIYIESRSLGPKEYNENEGSFSGYEWNEMNIVPEDNVDLEDRREY